MLILEVLTMASDRAHAFLMIAVSTLLRYSCVNLFLKSPSQAKVAMVEQTLADPWSAKVQGAFHYIGSPLRGFNMILLHSWIVLPVRVWYLRRVDACFLKGVTICDRPASRPVSYSA